MIKSYFILLVDFGFSMKAYIYVYFTFFDHVQVSWIQIRGSGGRPFK